MPGGPAGSPHPALVRVSAWMPGRVSGSDAGVDAGLGARLESTRVLWPPWCPSSTRTADRGRRRRALWVPGRPGAPDHGRQDIAGPPDRGLGGVAGRRPPGCGHHAGRGGGGLGRARPSTTLANGQRLETAARDRGRPARRAAVGAQGDRADRGRGPRPQREADLLAGADERPSTRCGSGANGPGPPRGRHDPVATVRRIRAGRHFSSWTDPEGAFCYQGRDTADRGAQILAHLGPVATRLRRARAASRGPGPEPERALRADAFFALVTRRHPDTGAPSDHRPDPSGPPAHRGRIDLDPDVDPDTIGPDAIRTWTPRARTAPIRTAPARRPPASAPGGHRTPTGRRRLPHRPAPDLLGGGPGGPGRPVPGPRRERRVL